MSDTKEYEAANLLLPMQNTDKVKVQYRGLAGPTTNVIGLPTAFGNHSKGYYTIAADGGKIYAALSTSPTGTIDPGAHNATGTPTAIGWPIADGTAIHGTIPGGRPEGATGPSDTTPTFISYRYLLYRTASGVGSALIHLRRSSLPPSGGVEEFFPPGHKRSRYKDY